MGADHPFATWTETVSDHAYAYRPDGEEQSDFSYYWDTLDLIQDGVDGPTDFRPASVGDFPCGTLADLAFFHGTYGDELLAGPTEKTDVGWGRLRTFDVAFDSLTAGSYGVRRRGVDGSSRWQRMHLKAVPGVWFERLTPGSVPRPGVKVALPDPGSPADDSHRGFAVAEFAVAAWEAGYDGYVTNDCCLIDDRHHFTLHLFSRSFDRIRVVAVVSHHNGLLSTDGRPSRGAGMVARLLDRWAPLARESVLHVRDLRTVRRPR